MRASWNATGVLIAAIALIVAAMSIAVVPVIARAQTFTRITDPANPIVTEIAESAGGSWIDLNGDGLLDLFIAKGNLSNQNDGLYLNRGAFVFQAVTTGPVVGSGGSSIGGAWGDWNGDGRPDLFVANRSSFGNFLFRGLGDTAFVSDTSGTVTTDLANSNSAAWLDLDNDGDLDLYVVNFQGDDFFYRNAGSPTWALSRVVLPTIGIGGEFSIHGTWADFDNDGDLDLFVANGGPQNDDLYVNQGNLTFVRRSLNDGLSTIGGSWGDYDNDGYLDLFATSNQNQPSVLYHNDGPPNWTLTPVSASVFSGLAAAAVGSAWGDVDNDGDLDLLVACDNGQNEALFLNDSEHGTFTRVTSGPLVASGGNSFGCSFADIDRDGDLDVFVANRSNQQSFLFRNDSPPGSWLGVRLRGPAWNSAGVGARVRVLASPAGTPRWQMQQVLPSTGYNSQNLELHFGLGQSTVVDSVEIQWPDGTLQRLAGVAGGQVVVISEHPTGGVPTAPGTAGPRLALASANPVRGPADLAITLALAGSVSISIVDIHGRLRGTPEVRSLPAGRSTLRLAATAALEPGVFWVRARGADGQSALRVAVLR